MRNSVKLALVVLLTAALCYLVSAMPDAWLSSIGAPLSPHGKVSDSFIPAFRRVLVASSAPLLFLSLAAIVFFKRVREFCAAAFQHISRELGLAAGALRRCLDDTPSFDRFVIASLAGMSVFIRIWYINQPMRFDEATTVNLFASSPWYIGLVNYSLPNNHILHTLLVRLCIVIGGYHEWVIRTPTFVAGLSCAAMGYVYARLMYSRNAAILTLAILSVSVPFVDMSTNARGYAIVALCGILAHVSVYFILNRGYILASVCYSLSLGLGLFAVPVAGFFVVSTLLWAGIYSCLLHRDAQLRPRNLLRYVASLVGAGAIAVLCYTPMLMVSGPQTLYANKNVTWAAPMRWSTFAHELPHQLYAYVAYDLKYLPAVLALALLFGGMYYALFWRRIEKTRIPLPFLAFIACLILLILARRFPIWGLSLIWMYLSVLWFASFAAGLLHCAGRFAGPQHVRLLALWLSLLVSGAGAANMIRANPSQTLDAVGGYMPPDAKDIAKYLATQATAGDKIVSDHAVAVYQYYGARRGLGFEMWDWDIAGAQRVFVIQSRKPERRYAKALWNLLHAYGVPSTNDLTELASFDSATVSEAKITSRRIE